MLNAGIPPGELLNLGNQTQRISSLIGHISPRRKLKGRKFKRSQSFHPGILKDKTLFWETQQCLTLRSSTVLRLYNVVSRDSLLYSIQ